MAIYYIEERGRLPRRPKVLLVMTFFWVFVLSVIARSASDVAISGKIFALKTHSLPLKGTPSNLEGEIFGTYSLE